MTRRVTAIGPVVAAVQMNSQAAPVDNLRSVQRLVGEAAAAGAELILLPENFAYFGAESGRAAVAERLGDATAPIQRCLIELAEQHGVHIIAGGMPELNAGGDAGSKRAPPPFNTSLVVSPGQPRRTSYRKIHLFDVDLPGGQRLRESSGTSAGNEPCVVGFEGLGVDRGTLRVGLSICYDVRFPELYRKLVDLGAELLAVSAAFTHTTGRAHWEVLLRARAIESQCFVIAAAQWGQHPGARQTWGHSMIIDPWGEILAEQAEGDGAVVARLDLQRLRDVRQCLPSLDHRRF